MYLYPHIHQLLHARVMFLLLIDVITLLAFPLLTPCSQFILASVRDLYV